MGRAAGDAGVRQIRRTRPELHLLEFEAEPVGRNLRKRGPGALTHVVRSRFHQAGSVAAHDRARFGLEHQRREGRGAYPPADEEARLVTQLSRRERAL